jgi:serine/threonine protein kinase
MLQGKLPFDGFTNQEFFKDIKQNYNNLKYKVPISNEAKDLIQGLLQLHPKKRMNWAEFFTHKFF